MRISVVSGVALAVAAGGTAVACLDRPTTQRTASAQPVGSDRAEEERRIAQPEEGKPEVERQSAPAPQDATRRQEAADPESTEQARSEPKAETAAARSFTDPSARNVWRNDGDADRDEASFYWDHALAEKLGCQDVQVNPEMNVKSYPGATFTWYYDDSGRPGSVSEEDVLNTVRESFAAVQELRNNCGIRGELNVDFKYGGKRDSSWYTTPTSRDVHEINVSFSDDLGGSVGRGGLRYGTRTANGDRHVFARGNVRLNPNTNWMTLGSPGCPSNFAKDRDLQKTDMQSTVMHEILHVLNVGHAEEGGTPRWNDTKNPRAYQTMASATATCSVWERTLGRGDIARLVEEYGLK
ncbi:hypothetical protein [Streptomyces wuyuanensis]|uniref:hypothetical protein n=1 Tax=Streptomyces wuyuanensis TaxID=1196353 RepID=UPI0034413093